MYMVDSYNSYQCLILQAVGNKYLYSTKVEEMKISGYHVSVYKIFYYNKLEN